MNSCESLYEKTQLTGVYDLSGDSEVYIELWAYGAALDEVCEQIDLLYRENFITTALGFGLSRRERLISAPSSSGLLPEQRRSILLEKFSAGENDFTPAALERLIASFGVEAVISENPQQMRIVIDADLSGLSESAVNLFVKSVLDFIPAHLEGEVVYKGRRWSEIDMENLTFEQIDAKNQTWAQFDAQE